MKNIFRYILTAASITAIAVSCEKMENFTTTVDAPSVLVYATTAGANNVHSIKVAHAPVGSFGSYEAVFPITCNSGSHKAASVLVKFDEAAAELYKAEKALEHTILSAEYLRIEKYVKGAELSTVSASETTLTLPADARVTSDSVKVSLVGDLSKLTDRHYIAALSISSNAFAGSEELGTYYIEVNTEINCIRPLENANQLAGMSSPDRSAWRYIQGLSGGVTGRVSLPGEPVEVVVDMQQNYILTGLKFGLYSTYGGAPTYSSIECSTDGETWQQAGTPDGSELNYNTAIHVAFYGYLEARYVKFTVNAASVSSWYRYISGFDIYYAESTDPTLYAECGNNNVLTGMIKHTPAGSTDNIDFSFPVKVAPGSSSTITGTVTYEAGLVEAYNEAHGTAYTALPASNLALSEAAFTIGAGEVASGNVTVRLTGDVAVLKAPAGYLVPLKVNSSASVSETAGVVYVEIGVIEQNLKSGPSMNDLDGWSIVSDRNAWVARNASGNTLSNVFGQSAWSGSSDDPIIVDFGSELQVGAVALCSTYANYGANYRINGATLSYSVDGNTFIGLGIAESTDFVWNGSYQVAVLVVPVNARYIKVSDPKAPYYYGLNNFNVYVK